MVNERSVFGLAVACLVAGLAVMLFGVSLNNGQSLNTPIIAGGVILLIAITLQTVGVMAIDGDEHAE